MAREAFTLTMEDLTILLFLLFSMSDASQHTN